MAPKAAEWLKFATMRFCAKRDIRFIIFDLDRGYCSSHTSWNFGRRNAAVLELGHRGKFDFYKNLWYNIIYRLFVCCNGLITPQRGVI